MEDGQLANYIVGYGDRLSIQDYCKRALNMKKDPRKLKLLEKLRQKFKLNRKRSGSESDNETEKPQKKQQTEVKQNSSKNTRVVELGLLMYDPESNRYKQIRQKKGGGTRTISLEKSARKDDIFKIGHDLFFPGGLSKLGKLHEFERDILDFKEISLDTESTIGQLYDQTKLKTLRFYLSCKRKNKNTLQVACTIDPPPAMEPVFLSGVSSSRESSANNWTIHSNYSLSQPIDILNHGGCPVDLLATQSEDSIYPKYYDQVDISSPNGSWETTFENDPSDYYLATPNEEETSKEVVLPLHCGNILNNMIQHFSDPLILTHKLKFERILPNGDLERAEDIGGVTRDCLSEFWTQFYEKCTTGRDVKVPFLRHDFTEDIWRSIGRVLVYGWKTENYFPIKLAMPVIEYCLWGIVKSDFLSSLLKYVPAYQEEILQKAVRDFSSVDMSDLIDVFDSLECRKKVDMKNVLQILNEIAHKEIIQAPMYVIECWRQVMGPTCMMMSSEQLSKLYTDLQPSNKKVLNLLHFPETDEGLVVTGYLKRYVRELDLPMLCNFLRFCTGSDLLTVPTIKVEFSTLEGLCRRPIIHTCSSLLEVPRNYESYLEFRTEFNSVLTSAVWVMDIV